MTLSLVLFNTVFTLSSGFDIDKYVEKFLNKDFIISSADYFNYNFARSETYLSKPLSMLSNNRTPTRMAADYIPAR